MFRSTLAPESACSRAGPPGYQMSSHTLTPTRVAVKIHDQGRPGTLPEVAVLVEDAVVWQVMFVVAVQYLATRDHGAGVVEVSVEVDEADGGHDALRNLPGELVERPHVLLDKARAHQEVLGRVAGDGQLGIARRDRAPESTARSRASAILSTFPQISPTVVLIWASATLIHLIYRAGRLRACPARFGPSGLRFRLEDGGRGRA